MGKMKIVRRLLKHKKGVSAVIGVILMLAITVAIAATVYVYVGGLLPGGNTPDYKISAVYLSKNTTAHNATYTIESADVGLSWSSVTANCIANDGTVTTGTVYHSPSGDAEIETGQTVTINCGGAFTGDIKLIYDGSDTLWTSPTISV